MCVSASQRAYVDSPPLVQMSASHSTVLNDERPTIRWYTSSCAKNRLGISAVAFYRRPSYPLRLISLSAPYDGRAAAIGAGSQMGFRPLNDARECCTAHFHGGRVSPVALCHWPKGNRHLFRVVAAWVMVRERC
jgi:hypothetical protein